jgi:nitroimidazol reductase NimA-like FMN-containing flavoprotein (pyridoxamine 5'-phosphate oxidase superfamily)
MSGSLPVTERTRLRRRPQRGSHEMDTILRILDAGLLCHVGYVIAGEPFVTPTAYWREGHRLYWHGSAASRMLRALAPGLPVCVTVSHLDGLVLSRTGFTHSVLYRSVVVFGRTAAVADRDGKRRAMDAFLDRLYPGRRQELRPTENAELDAIEVVSIPIEEASAKIRDGGVLDKEEDLGVPCWAGVIPVRATLGASRPDSGILTDPALPAPLAGYRAGASLDEVLLAMASRDAAG